MGLADDTSAVGSAVSWHDNRTSSKSSISIRRTSTQDSGDRSTPLVLSRQGTADEMEAPLKWTQRVWYGLPAFSTTSLTITIALYANDFYVNMGTNLAFLAFFTAWARSMDVISDPVMGWISDTTVKRFGVEGRRKPYMFWGPFLYGIFFIALFYPPPFYPNSPGEKMYSPDGHFRYGSNVDGFSTDEPNQNLLAGYWFGATYVLFYLSDTMTNIPYEALGPELHSDPEERSKLFFSQKIFNMMGMIVGAISPSLIAAGARWYTSSSEVVPCSYVFHGNSSSGELLHGTLPDQLLYIDVTDTEVVNKTGALCRGDEGDFCFEHRYTNGSHFWYETAISTIENICTGKPADTPLTLDRYEMSSLEAMQLGFVSTAVGFGLYHILTMQLLCWKVKEKVQTHRNTLPLVSSVMRSLNNAAFRPLLGAWALDGLALAALVTMFPFYIRYVIQPDGVTARDNGQEMDPNVCMALFVIILLVTAMLSSIGWLWLARRAGKFVAWQAFNFVNAFTNLMFFAVGPGDSYLVLAAGALNGIPVGGQFLVNTIMSDVIDYDEFLNKSRSEASFAVFSTLIPKFVAIPASAVPLAVINLLGFVQPIAGVAQAQNETVKRFIQVTFVMLPFSCAVLSFCLKFLYPIKTNDTAKLVHRGIKQFKSGCKRVYDPILNEDVAQRSFSPADDKQAVLMEMFTEHQLQHYKDSLTGANDLYATAPVDMKDSQIIDQPSTGLSRIAKTPMLCYAVLTAVCVAGTAGSFPLLGNQKTSILPIMCCIAFGFSLCMLGVTSLRWWSSRILQQYQLITVLHGSGDGNSQVHPIVHNGDDDAEQTTELPSASHSSPLQHHVFILAEVISMKRRGAAGGHHSRIRETIKLAQTAAAAATRTASLSAAAARHHLTELVQRKSRSGDQPTAAVSPTQDVSDHIGACRDTEDRTARRESSL